MKNLVIFVISIIMLVAGKSYAATTDWNKIDEASARLIFAGTETRDSGDKYLKAGIHIKLADKWKTYWRTPGDGGLPVTADWSKSRNIDYAEIKWPAPHRFVQFETIETYGYKSEVVFPVIIKLKDASKDTDIDVKVNYAACDETCIFLNPEFKIKIPSTENDYESRTLIENFEKLLPLKNGSNGVKIESADITENGKLEIKVKSGSGISNEADIFVELNDDFRFPHPEKSFSADGKEAVFKFSYEILLASERLEGKKVRLTFVDKNQSVDTEIELPDKLSESLYTPASSDNPAIDNNINKTDSARTQTEYPAPSISTSNLNLAELLPMIFIAILGGMILNVMPCVLPVLSIKLIGVIKHGGKDRKYITFSFLMSAAGIIFSFLLLAAVVISLRATGKAAGFGFQFQEPVFVISMILLLVLFACNQWGFFEIRLPTWFTDKIIRKSPKYDDHHPISNFLTGVFATLLATPCLAPFVTTAVGFALTRDILTIMVIFAFMGVGLSLPYLFFAMFPGLINRMPKPGEWMIKVKNILGFFLLATAGWLLWVMGYEIGREAASILLLLCLVIISVIKNRTKIIVAELLIAVLLVAAFIIPMMFSTPLPSNTEKAVDEQKIDRLVSEGQIVFVDVTAEWCLTCKYNKIRVLNQKDVKKFFVENNVEVITVDYTSANQEISNYLLKFGRHGIPMNVIYGEAAPEGLLLPEIIDKQMVFEAIEKARHSEVGG